MAKQLDLYKLKGTIGDLTFYKTKDGYMVRSRGGVAKERIATDPKFQRTRENGAEFGRAGATGKIIRTAFKNILKQAADGRVVSRLVTSVMDVMKTDTVSARGLRQIIHGDMGLLQGFNFNVNAVLESVFTGAYHITVNRTAGNALLAVPAYIPDKDVKFPVAATHCKLVASGGVINFETGAVAISDLEGDENPLNNVPASETNFTFPFPANSTLPIFIVMGIEFYQELNGSLYLLKNGGYNGVGVVKVDA